MESDTKAAEAVVAERAIQGVVSASAETLREVVHPEATNREASTEPPDTRGRGPAAFLATGAWLGTAFGDLTWTTEEHVVDGDLVVTYGTLSGTHRGEFVVWTPDAQVERVFVPTGKSFAVRQAHFQRVQDGLVTEHWAVRDDQGMAVQCGWIPPTPLFLLKCARATKKARKAAARNRA